MNLTTTNRYDNTMAPASTEIRYVLRCDLPSDCDKAMEAINQFMDVTVLDSTHTISPMILKEIHNRVNYEFSNMNAVYVTLEGIRTLNEFVDRMVNTILFNVSEDDIQMLTLARDYFNLSFEVKVDFNEYGLLGQYIHFSLGDNPLESAKEILHICDIICDAIQRELVICLDYVDEIENLKNIKERHDFVSLFQKYLWHLQHITLVAALRSKNLHDTLTSGLRPHQWLSIGIASVPVEFTKLPKDQEQEQTQETEREKEPQQEAGIKRVKRKLGRPAGSKNKKTLEAVKIDAAKDSTVEPAVKVRRAYKRRSQKNAIEQNLPENTVMLNGEGVSSLPSEANVPAVEAYNTLQQPQTVNNYWANGVNLAPNSPGLF